MRRPRPISRRTVLGSAGLSLGLPMLECMVPGSKAARADLIPKRLVFFIIPNGTPDYPRLGREGCLYPAAGALRADAVTELMKPLHERSLLDDILMISGLANACDSHYAGTQALLTGVVGIDDNARGRPRAGISIDQVAANWLKSRGITQKLPSLYLGTSRVTASYNEGNYLSWSGPTLPSPASSRQARRSTTSSGKPPIRAPRPGPST